MKQYTDITVLLDRSGSMRSIKEATEAGWETFISEHRGVPTTRVTLIQFDDIDDHDVVFDNVPVTDHKLHQLNLRPRGNTPLLDAMVKAIDCTGERLFRMNEADRPDQVLFVIITDGQENASQRYNRRDVFNRISHQRDAYKWQFVYLGANQDAIAEAQSFNIPIGTAANFAATQTGMGSTMRSAMANTMSYAVRESSTVPDFSDSQRKEMVDDPTAKLPETTKKKRSLTTK